ncbi:hypothetical protein [Shewanella waksmanii]|uniref:hypothetical protein n=1 Tax=Shewanella waksmanii TaxID=213783 RepID=UPI003735ED1B
MTNHEIGGFFELELPKVKCHYHHGLKLNTARSALYLILQECKPSKIYVPYYMCHVVLDVFKSLNVEYDFYNINKDLGIVERPVLKESEYLLYVNYFGVKDDYVTQLAGHFGAHLIVDNSQAFFSKMTENVKYYFYSARKFFGVADGAYLYGVEEDVLSGTGTDVSGSRMEHLLGRFEDRAVHYYSAYKKNDESLSHVGVRKMSKLTGHLLSLIDYETAMNARAANFEYLASRLNHLNGLSLFDAQISAPMSYPLLLAAPGLSEYLISNQVYVAKYWPELNDIVYEDEMVLVNCLIPLPIDHRYDITDMKRIVSLIFKFLESKQ